MAVLITIALGLIKVAGLAQQRFAQAPIWVTLLPSLGAITFRGGQVSANSERSH